MYFKLRPNIDCLPVDWMGNTLTDVMCSLVWHQYRKVLVHNAQANYDDIMALNVLRNAILGGEGGSTSGTGVKAGLGLVIIKVGRSGCSSTFLPAPLGPLVLLLFSDVTILGMR